jgi:hypothetical protein
MLGGPSRREALSRRNWPIGTSCARRLAGPHSAFSRNRLYATNEKGVELFYTGANSDDKGNSLIYNQII